MSALADIASHEAAAEALRRRRARASLVEFSQAIEIPGAPISEDPDEWLFKPIETSVAKHHIVIMEALQQCIESDYGRLMILAPPGSAKSTYASVVAPTWAMGKMPGLRVLMTSYAAKPIVRASKRARQIVASKLYTSLWEKPTTLVGGSTAADEWELANGSGLFAAGLMGGITSSRCDLGIVDDPVAGREEADSENIQSKTRDAYADDFLSRLKPNASIILIQTRWNQADLAGGILPEDYAGQSGPIECRDGQTWNVLCIPAQAENADDPLGREIGEYLWPEWFSPRHWNIYRGMARTWSSLYQQRPVPEDGIHFKREDMLRYSQTPPNLRWYMTSDYATKEGKGDNTAHIPFGLDETADIWIEPGFNERVETDKGTAAALSLAKQYNPQLWFGEAGPIESAIGPMIKRDMRLKRKFVARHLLPSVHEKGARIAAFSGLVSAGVVHIKDGAFGDALIEQLIAFPAGKFDDMADCCSLIGRALDMIFDGEGEPEKDKREPVIPFTRRHFESLDREDEVDERAKANYYR